MSEALVARRKRLMAKSTSELAVQDLPIESLQVGTFQPRQYFAEKPLQQLADSISDHGVMQPILVRPVEEGKYEIIAGERRWRASKLANKNTIPAIVHDKTDDQAARLSLIENIQREELDAVEEAIAIQRLMTEFELSQKAVSRAIGKSESYISRMLNLIRYTSEETRQRVISGELKPNSPEVTAEIKANKKQDPNANKAGRKADGPGTVRVHKTFLSDVKQMLIQVQSGEGANPELVDSLEAYVTSLKA